MHCSESYTFTFNLEVEIVHTLKTLLLGVNRLIGKLYAFHIISKSYRRGREVLGE